jgi:pimeloyl-ACP methyl ester carboxylesterase
MVRAYLEPVAGTKERAVELQRWVASLHNRDLAAVEPALRKLTVPALMVWGTGDVFFRLRHAEQLREMIPGTTGVVTPDGGRLFFPDERAAGLVTHLRAHWAAHHASAGPA